MDPNQFLDLISYATTRDEDLVRLGTISTVADPATKASVVFDGEDTATSKEYFLATSDGLVVNDRVMLVRAGHSWLIMGRVPSTSGFTNGPLNVEGDINFQNNALISADGGSNNIDHIWHDDGNNTWNFVSDGSYKQAGNSAIRVGHVEIGASTPQVHFLDEDASVGFWFHQNGSLFYLLPDRDGSGGWETPYPFRVDIGGDSIKFWNGGNELEILNGSSMIRGEGNYTFGAWSALFLRAGNTDHWQIGTGGDLVAEDHSSSPRLVINNSNRGHNFVGDSDTGLTRRAAGSGGLNLQTDGQATMLATSGSTGTIAPSSDNNVNLGTSGLRWEHLFVADGQVRTSDSSQKEDVQPSDLGLDFVRRLTPIRYRRKDGGNRPRYGLAADAVRTVLDDMGVDDFGGYVDPSIVDPAKSVNPWAVDTLAEQNRKSLRTKAISILEVRRNVDEFGEGDIADLMEEIRQTREVGWQEDFQRDKDAPKGLRYDEFIAPMIKAIQELSDRMDNLERTTRP